MLWCSATLSCSISSNLFVDLFPSAAVAYKCDLSNLKLPCFAAGSVSASANLCHRNYTYQTFLFAQVCNHQTQCTAAGIRTKCVPCCSVLLCKLTAILCHCIYAYQVLLLNRYVTTKHNALQQASGRCQPALHSSTEQWGMHFALNSCAAVHWCQARSHLYEEQMFMGVLAVTHGCCQPALQSSTEQWGASCPEQQCCASLVSGHCTPV